MEVSVETTGVKTQAERLAAMGKASTSILRSGINANLKVGTKGIAAAANVFDHGQRRSRIVNDHYVEPGGLQASIGSRLEKSRSVIAGKAGPGVGKSQVSPGGTVSKGSKNAVPYGHLTALGTDRRYTGFARKRSRGKLVDMKRNQNRILHRGVSPAFHFVDSGYHAVKSQADDAGVKAMEKRIRKLEAGQKAE